MFVYIYICPSHDLLTICLRLSVSREVSTSERELYNVEKKLMKSKETLDRYIRDSLVKGERSASFDHSSHSISGLGGLGGLGSGSILNPGANMGIGTTFDDMVTKYEREIKDDVRTLLRAIANRDQMTSASRRAYQTLDRTTKNTILSVVKKITERERQTQVAREAALVALEEAVLQYSVEGDEEDFIGRYSSDNDCFMQSSQALNILGDLVIPGGGSGAAGGGTPSNIGSGINATTDSPLDKDSSGSSGNNSSSSSTSATGAGTGTGGTSTSSSTGAEGGASASGPFSTLFSSLASVTQSNSNTNTNSSTNTTVSGSGSDGVKNKPNPPQPPPTLPPRELVVAPITYDDKSNANTGNSSTQLSNAIHEYLSCIFYMTNNSQLHPTYISLIQGQGQGPITQVPLDVLIFCQESKKSTGSVSGTTTGGEVSKEHSYNIPLIEAVNSISDIVQSKEGRAAFVACLNIFRSRQVNVGISYGWLAAVMWLTLDYCHSCNDVHSAKIIMMLSQVSG